MWSPTVAKVVPGEPKPNNSFIFFSCSPGTTFATVGLHTNPLGMSYEQAYPLAAADNGKYFVKQVEEPYITNDYAFSGSVGLLKSLTVAFSVGLRFAFLTARLA